MFRGPSVLVVVASLCSVVLQRILHNRIETLLIRKERYSVMHVLCIIPNVLLINRVNSLPNQALNVSTCVCVYQSINQSINLFI